MNKANNKQPSHTTVIKRAFYCEMPAPQILLWPKSDRSFNRPKRWFLNHCMPPCERVCAYGYIVSISVQYSMTSTPVLTVCDIKFGCHEVKLTQFWCCRKFLMRGMYCLVSLKRATQQSKFKCTYIWPWQLPQPDLPTCSVLINHRLLISLIIGCDHQIHLLLD